MKNNYLSSLSKLEHQEQNRNHRYSQWQTEKNVLPIFSEGMFMEKVNYIHTSYPEAERNYLNVIK